MVFSPVIQDIITLDYFNFFYRSNDYKLRRIYYNYLGVGEMKLELIINRMCH